MTSSSSNRFSSNGMRKLHLYIDCWGNDCHFTWYCVHCRTNTLGRSMNSLYFVVHFLISRLTVLSFLSRGFDVFRSLPVCFPFNPYPTTFLLYLLQTLLTADWEQQIPFPIFHRGLFSWMSFMIISIVSIKSSFVGAMFPFSTAC